MNELETLAESVLSEIFFRLGVIHVEREDQNAVTRKIPIPQGLINSYEEKKRVVSELTNGVISIPSMVSILSNIQPSVPIFLPGSNAEVDAVLEAFDELPSDTRNRWIIGPSDYMPTFVAALGRYVSHHKPELWMDEDWDVIPKYEGILREYDLELYSTPTLNGSRQPKLLYGAAGTIRVFFDEWPYVEDDHLCLHTNAYAISASMRVLIHT